VVLALFGAAAIFVRRENLPLARISVAAAAAVLAAGALASRKSAPAVRGRLLVRRSFLPKCVKAASPTPPLASVLSGRSMESLPVGMSSLAASSTTLTPPAEDQDMSPTPRSSVVWVDNLTTETLTAVGMSSAAPPQLWQVQGCAAASAGCRSVAGVWRLGYGPPSPARTMTWMSMSWPR
jgi:hypothetical protein